ncbi:MAG: phosphate acetyltransferase [Candidatus Woesearchaeota archaeon]
MTLLDDLKSKAKETTRRIVFPESTDERVLQAAHRLLGEGICEVILLGIPEDIKSKGRQLGAVLSKATIIDYGSDKDRQEKYAQALVMLRQHKGMDVSKARELLKDPVYFATMMVQTGDADGMVSGAEHATADTLRPALQIIGTKPEVTIASSFFLILAHDMVDDENSNTLFFFADCGFVVDPDAKQLSEIGFETAQSAKSFGIDPKVGFLSFSTKGSASHEKLHKVVEATSLFRERAPDIPVDGELQLDAAIIPSVCEKKCGQSPLQGNANILIFPDLNSGNIAYKLVQRFGHAKAIGPIIQGLNKPVNDLSRGCSAEDIVNVAIITAVEAIE